MNADDYNALQDIAAEHVTEMTRIAQDHLGLIVDGKCGPITRAALGALRESGAALGALRESGLIDPDLSIVDGWLYGPAVSVQMIHPSWGYPALSTLHSEPVAIVAHYTATGHGTAGVMARRRMTPYRRGVDRPACWHVSIDGDGRIVQMIRFTRGGWHSRGKIPGIGAPNRTAVGIELVGHGERFPPAQVRSATRVWRALVASYAISRDVAMVAHSSLDPSRRSDPGPVWMSQYAETVLDSAFSP